MCVYKCAFCSDNVLLAAFESEIKMFLILFEIPFRSIQLENSLIIKIKIEKNMFLSLFTIANFNATFLILPQFVSITVYAYFLY